MKVVKAMKIMKEFVGILGFIAFTPFISFMFAFGKRALDAVGEPLNVEVDQQCLLAPPTMNCARVKRPA